MQSSKLYEGTLYHKRFTPTQHEFTYPCYTFALDLDELPELDKTCFGFGLNRFSIFSIHAKDYLVGQDQNLFIKAKSFISRYHSQSLAESITNIALITSPRFLNYVFNPVSFFYGYDKTKTLKVVIAEVHNTFNEKHFYILDNPILQPHKKIGFKCDKHFHVSPFFDQSGHYEFLFESLSDHLSIQIKLMDHTTVKLLATLKGKKRPFNSKELWKLFVKYPFSICLTFPRIVYQSLILFFSKKLSVYTKPKANHPMTYPIKKQTFIQKNVLKVFKSLKNGQLTLTFPDKTTQIFGDTSSPAYDLSISENKFFTRLALYGEIGMGESYMAGEWDTSDLTALLGFFLDNIQNLESDSLFLQKLFSKLNDFTHHARENSINNSTTNIREHYDLSNDLFKLFLDETMTYSSGIFLSKTDSLHDAQITKIHRIIDKAKIDASHHILEIGCGWGGFAIEAVKRTGCKVTGITLSQDQYDIAVERVKKEGLSDKISIQICDYRKLTGQFDRIISIEMLEAVGHKFLSTYFKQCDHLLKPNGVMVLQTITIPDHRYESYRKEADWIQKHIFPGGHLPCLSKISEILTKETTLLIDHAENIGPHYAPTLALWRERFSSEKAYILSLGFTEEFIRKWIYYFSYCETGFKKRYLGNYQLVLTRIGNPALALDLSQ